jgi:hypothetical protein
MKMSGSLIIGIIFILLGIYFILKVIFKIDFPVGRILVALFFLYLGIKILFGSSHVFHFRGGDGNSAVFSELNYSGEIEDGGEYSAVFGKVNLDLRNVVLTQPETYIKVNAVFGGSEIFLPPGMPVKIKSDVVFGGIQLPDGNSGGFGSAKYKSETYDSAATRLYIEANAVFGGVQVHQY